MLRLTEIRKQYVTSSEKVDALRGIDLAFRKSEFVSILGPSGCGKTTLLNIIGGLDHYTSGDLVISGKSTKDFSDHDWDVYRNHRIGFIFQSYNLIPHQTVLGNVELALTIAGIDKKERIERAKRALDRVGLENQYYKRPNQLSGGQCQRVAIARALVNDPEILLADEPTGALDTQTSVQIMDLIREISGERLVIMVTHNPELAEQYSSRIVRLRDGQVTEDSMPFTAEDEIAECEALKKEKEEAELAAAKEAEDERQPCKKAKTKEQAKMSVVTAFLLSLRNLISKRGRTAMVGVAGSIGITGVALVLAFSAGIKGYIASMQNDMLSGNPITIEEAAIDLDSFSTVMTVEEKTEIIRNPDRVYINSMLKYIAGLDRTVNTMVVKNEITPEYIEYVKAMPEEYRSAITVDYGAPLSANVYTDFRDGQGGERRLSVAAITAIGTAMMEDSALKDYAGYYTSLSPEFRLAPNSRDYIAEQYDLLSGDYADEKDEIMLVLNRNSELSDLLLTELGFLSAEDLYDLLEAAIANDKTADVPEDLPVETFVGKNLYWYPNDTVFSVQNETTHTPLGDTTETELLYFADAQDFTVEEKNGITLKITGVLMAKEEVSYGCLSSGIYYTQALADHVRDSAKDSKIVEFYRTATTEQLANGIFYDFDYLFHGKDLTPIGLVGSPYGNGGISALLASYVDKNTVELMRKNLISSFGYAELPEIVEIYPVSFESKDLVTAYLDAWNDDEGAITVDGTSYEKDARNPVKYTDTLSLIIDMINKMIDIISYALISFTSVSLVVSTVMIGIITYVSVVERIKEIGVIRALGGRKRDVRHLFNAETFIIGLLAGLIGVAGTYLISEIVNLILYPLIHIRRIAALPIYQAGLLVLLSILLTSISGLIPASSAAKKDPVIALRTE